MGRARLTVTTTELLELHSYMQKLHRNLSNNCSCLEFLGPKLLFTVSGVTSTYASCMEGEIRACIMHGRENHACFMHGGGRPMHASCMVEEPCMFHEWNGRRVHVSYMKYVETYMFYVQNFQQGKHRKIQPQKVKHQANYQRP